MEIDIRNKTCKSHHVRVIQASRASSRGRAWGRIGRLSVSEGPFPGARGDCLQEHVVLNRAVTSQVVF